MNNMDTVQIIQELNHLNKRLSDAYKEMYQQAKLYSEAERNYKIKQRHKILELKSAGNPATLILELAKGEEEVANARFERDLAQGRYETAKESIRSMRTSLTVYQSILKLQDEV